MIQKLLLTLLFCVGCLSLRPIPGVDFVGFGFDARYDDPDEALTLPILQWTYDFGKTYTYPPYPVETFLVPDEVFVRTMSLTETKSFYYSNSSEYKKTNALNIGISVTFSSDKDGTSDESITPPTTASCNATAPNNNVTVDGENPCEVRKRAPEVNTAILQSAAADNTSTIRLSSGFVTKTTNRVFSLGSKFSYVQSSSKQSETWIVQLEQKNQMYQLLVDKRDAALGISEAISNLKVIGQTYAQNPSIYFDFLEKWGTHYVISAIFGGSAEMISTVDKQADTTSSSTILNVTLQLNSTVNATSSSSSAVDNFVADAPECARLSPPRSGWTLDKAASATKGSSVCYEPLYLTCNTNIFTETWQFDSSSTKYKTGPDTSIISRWCQDWRHCRWWGGCHNHRECYTVNPVFPNMVTSSSTTQMQLVSTNRQNYDNLNDKGWYIDYPEQNAGTKTLRPGLIQFVFARTANQNLGAGVVKFIDTGADASNTADDKTCFTFQALGGQLGLRTSNSHSSSTFTGFTTSRQLSSQHEISLVVDWASGTVDLWIKDLGPGTNYRNLVVRKVNFIEKCTKISRVEFWNEDRTATATFQPINYCNSADGAKYNEVPKMTAVATVNTVFKQSLSGRTDFAYQSTFSNASTTATSNWKLRGGDTIKLDLLDTNKAAETINNWKTTIYNNPGAVSYFVKPISSLFPTPTAGEIDFRAQMDVATQQFLTQSELINNPFIGPASCTTENCNVKIYSVPTFIERP